MLLDEALSTKGMELLGTDTDKQDNNIIIFTSR
jgi:hypothetical protein